MCQAVMCCEDSQAELGGQSFSQSALGNLGVLRVKNSREQPSQKEALQRQRIWGNACMVWLKKTREASEVGQTGSRGGEEVRPQELGPVQPHRAWSGQEFTLNKMEILQSCEQRKDRIGIQFQRPALLAVWAGLWVRMGINGETS